MYVYNTLIKSENKFKLILIYIILCVQEIKFRQPQNITADISHSGALNFFLFKYKFTATLALQPLHSK